MSNYFRSLEGKDRSAFFAKVAQIAYELPGTALPLFDSMGFRASYIEEKDAEVYVLVSDTDIIVACRGTEVSEPKDLKTDIQAWPKSSPHSKDGLVHFGFNKYVNRVWQPIAVQVMTNANKDLYFCGHSLGAAMASIMAIYCQVNPLLINPTGLYTFGSPRTGSSSFVKQGKDIYHERWVNNTDIVTSVPLWLMGYRHFGKLMYLNHFGNFRNLSLIQRIKDYWRGTVKGFKTRRAAQFSNHSMDAYLSNIERYRDDLENTQDQ
jgi:triacylglycerol lipase